MTVPIGIGDALGMRIEIFLKQVGLYSDVNQLIMSRTSTLAPTIPLSQSAVSQIRPLDHDVENIISEEPKPKKVRKATKKAVLVAPSTDSIGNADFDDDIVDIVDRYSGISSTQINASSTGSVDSGGKVYMPRPMSGGYALLIALYINTTEQRQTHMTRAALIVRFTHFFVRQ